jgi:pilus assembly protein CpaF
MSTIKKSHSEDDEERKKKKKIDEMRQTVESPTHALGAPFNYVALKNRVQSRLVARLDPALDLSERGEGRARAEKLYGEVLAEESIVLSRAERKRLWDQIVLELSRGLGPLEPLLQDPLVREIMVDGPSHIYVERKGKLEDAPARFRDEAHLMEIIRRIAEPLGRRVDESHPMVDMRLEDGSRVNVVIPPIALSGPMLTIRKFWKTTLTVEDLIGFGAWTEGMVTFLRAVVAGRANLVISGGTGSGKTTLANLIAQMIADGERIITVEMAAELDLPRQRVVRLEARPPNLEGRGEVSVRDLVQNALRMRPDRIILGEARGAEVLDFLQAMNTGHDGSFCTIHATNPRDALARLEVMASSGNPSIPLVGLREQMASAINFIVHIERLPDGSRKVMRVTEVQGLQGDALLLADIFAFQQTGFEGGRVQGRFAATGQIPKFLSRLRDAGIQVPMDLFAPG